MERRFRVHLDELLDDAVVPAAVPRACCLAWGGSWGRSSSPWIPPPQRAHARHYAAGLLSDLGRKNAEGIAYLHGQERQGLQKFLGQAAWQERPLLTELARQVGEQLGEPDGVLVLDPSGFPKKGDASVGVQRQWCGRLGKIDNCQVAVYLGYATRVEHALVDCRLYLPREWAKDMKRRAQAGVPKGVRFRTRHELALHLLDEHGPRLPHAWVTGDDEIGRCGWFRAQLRQRAEPYLLAVPSSTSVRDLTAARPSPGRGRPPAVPFQRVDRWAAAQPAAAWQTVEVLDGAKSPLRVQGARTLVQARSDGRVSDAVEWLVVFREPQGGGSWKHDYLLADAPPDGRRILEAIERLPEGEREAFDVVRIQGMSQAEAAEVLGVSVMTVNRRLNRGLQLLLAALGDLYPGEGQPGTS
jgi:hypothetical protein